MGTLICIRVYVSGYFFTLKVSCHTAPQYPRDTILVVPQSAALSPTSLSPHFHPPVSHFESIIQIQGLIPNQFGLFSCFVSCYLTQERDHLVLVILLLTYFAYITLSNSFHAVTNNQMSSFLLAE